MTSGRSDAGRFGGNLVIRDLAGHRIERAFDVVHLVPGREILPAEPQLQRQRVVDTPHVIDERREGGRLVGRASAPERSRARRAVAQKEVRNGVRRVVGGTGGAAVEGEPAPRAGRRVLVGLAPLGLEAEPQRMWPCDFAGRIRHAVDPVGRVGAHTRGGHSREPGDRGARTSVVVGIGRTIQVLQADVCHPVPREVLAREPRLLSVEGVVVADTGLVDGARRDHPGMPHRQVPPGLGLAGIGNRAGKRLLAVVPDVSREGGVGASQHVIHARRPRIRVIGEVADRSIIVGTGRIRRRDGGDLERGERRDPRLRNEVPRERLPRSRVDDGRRDAGEIPGQPGWIRQIRKLDLALRLSQTFITAKQEQLVVHQRPAGRAAELVARVWRLAHGEIVLCLQRIVAEVFVGGERAAVGAGLGDHRDHRLPLTVLGREGVPQQVDLLHRVDRRIE